MNTEDKSKLVNHLEALLDRVRQIDSNRIEYDLELDANTHRIYPEDGWLRTIPGRKRVTLEISFAPEESECAT